MQPIISYSIRNLPDQLCSTKYCHKSSAMIINDALGVRSVAIGIYHHNNDSNLKSSDRLENNFVINAVKNVASSTYLTLYPNAAIQIPPKIF